MRVQVLDFMRPARVLHDLPEGRGQPAAHFHHVFVFDPVVPTLISPMTSADRPHLIAAGLLGFTGVALGAFGAHALKDTLVANGTTSAWQTAVLYQLVHAAALLALPSGRWAGRCWVAGIVLFCGSLYWLSLGGPKILGPVTPLGGVAFLLGWALVAWNAFRLPKP
jgi:uncharacterized membrane protein YgdD (TMEM256/DUF423 family)